MGFSFLYGRPVFDDLSLRADNYSGADRTFHGLAVHQFLSKRPILLHHFRLRIGQEGERQLVFGGKLIVGLNAVLTDAQYHRTRFFQRRAQIPKTARFLRTARRIIAWIKVENNSLTTIVLK